MFKGETGKLPSKILTMTLRSPLDLAPPHSPQQLSSLVGHCAATLVSEGPKGQPSSCPPQPTPACSSSSPNAAPPLQIIPSHPKCSPLQGSLSSSKRGGNDSARMTSHCQVQKLCRLVAVVMGKARDQGIGGQGGPNIGLLLQRRQRPDHGLWGLSFLALRGDLF